MTECSNNINDDEQQLIKLSLKKPKKWNWELSTSKSSSNIAFPKIQLFDGNNETLLAETNEANFAAGSKLRKSASVSKANVGVKSYPITNDSFSLKTPLSAESDVVIKNDSKLYVETKQQHQRNSRSSSVRSRSSILTRIREFTELNRESTDDDDDENKQSNSLKSEDDLKRKYSMRTCNIGTIIVKKESFSRCTRRRRRKSDININSSFYGEFCHTKLKIYYFYAFLVIKYIKKITHNSFIVFGVNKCVEFIERLIN